MMLGKQGEKPEDANTKKSSSGRFEQAPPSELMFTVNTGTSLLSVLICASYRLKLCVTLEEVPFLHKSLLSLLQPCCTLLAPLNPCGD